MEKIKAAYRLTGMETKGAMNMGDEIKTGNDEFTPEELAALGEAPEEKEEKQEAEPENEREEKEPDKEPEPEAEKENMIPQSAFDRRVAEIRAQAEEKLKLFKSDPEEYFRKYPDEKPEAKPRPTDFESGKKQEAQPSDPKALKVEGGAYDGWTFGDVFKRDPRAAYQIDPYYARILHDEQIEAERNIRTQQENLKSESKKEVVEFQSSLSKELFNKDLNEATADEVKEIEGVIKSVLDFMATTKRGGGVLADAYWLMNRDSETKKAAAKGAEKIIDAAKKGKVASISSSKAGAVLTGYEAIEGMTPDQLSAEIDKMPAAKYREFCKKAPKSIRDKFPNIPWD